MALEIKKAGNTIRLVDTNTTQIVQTISVQFFSYEYDEQNNQIIFQDNNLEGKNITALLTNLSPEGGGSFDTLGELDTYLAGLTSLGSVTLESGSEVQLIDGNGNPMEVQNGIGSEVTKGFYFMGEDENGFPHRVRVTPSGELVATASVTNPPGSNAITEVHLDSILSSQDDDYIIPNGQFTIIQDLSAGGEADSDGSKVELWYFTDATKTVGQLLSVLFVNGSNGNDPINVAYTGDGNARITMRRKRLAGAGKEIFGKWRGYYYP